MISWTQNINGRGVQGWHITGQCKDVVSFEGRGPYFVSGYDGRVVQSQAYCVFFTHCGGVQYLDYYDVKDFLEMPEGHCETCKREELLRALV